MWAVGCAVVAYGGRWWAVVGCRLQAVGRLWLWQCGRAVVAHTRRTHLDILTLDTHRLCNGESHITDRDLRVLTHRQDKGIRLVIAARDKDNQSTLYACVEHMSGDSTAHNTRGV